MTKVLVSDPIADKGIELLEEAGFDVIYNPNPSNDELQTYTRDINAWIVRSGTKITSGLNEKFCFLGSKIPYLLTYNGSFTFQYLKTIL